MRAQHPASILAGVLLQSLLVHSENVYSLAGNGWTLSNPALNISVPAHLPSQAHLDLYANQVIGDPYYGLNNYNLRWVAWNNWTYTTSEPISGLAPNASSAWLLFNGLDTFTSISFCGQLVANTDNQFRQYWFDIAEILASCAEENRTLSINFGSAPNIAAEIAAIPGQETWPAGVELVYQFPDRWFIRKEQSDFGWDWGPAFAPAGPWQPAWLVQLAPNEIYVRNSIVDIYRRGQLNNLPPDQTQPWVVNASLDYFGSMPVGAVLNYTITAIDNKTTISHGSLGSVNITNSTLTGVTTIPSEAVELWWPSQLGAQNLYYITIDALTPGGASLATVTKRVGFRTIVLNENPISQAQLAQGIAAGNNWHFEINGHEFYAKGSNFIPPDAFWPRVTPERIDQLFSSVIAGNQNMLRVWASGAYSPDFMYDLADEKGILLWSEFEFGDALYPVDQTFLDNVREEAEYQVRRINHHPSLALWAGGNELENLELESTVNDTAPEELPRYMAEYEELFLDVLLPVVFGNSRSISYTPSSTSNGWLSLNFSNPIPIVERYMNLTPGSVYGETDFYNYDPAVLYNDSAYPIGRFSNEFGFHSMPSIQSWRQQISDADLYFNSTTIKLRNQHNPQGGLEITTVNSDVGMAEMTEAVQMWYPIPNKTDSIANFSAWCHATQIFQADLYKSEIEFYRRGSGLPNRQLGSLYWQLEDIWVGIAYTCPRIWAPTDMRQVAPTWAGIEYDGRWKVLHYTAKDIYDHVIIAPYYNMTTGNLSIWATSDLWEPVTATANFSWLDWSGASLNVNMSSSLTFQIGAINSTQVLQTFTTHLLRNLNTSNAVLRMQVSAPGVLPNGNAMQTFTHENWFNPVGLNEANLVDPKLHLSYNKVERKFNVTATSGVAAWVWLDYPAGAVIHFDRNAFWLAKGASVEVGYTVQSDTTNGGWISGVTVESMWNQTLAY